MKVTYLLMWSQAMGGTERSIITQAGALAALGHDVRVVGVLKDAPEPFFRVPTSITWSHLVDATDPERPSLNQPGSGLSVREQADLLDTPSRLVPRDWESGFSALTDHAVRRALPEIDTDILVTTTPALMALAVEWAPESVLVVHQEHRTSELRGSTKAPLLVHGPRADALVALTTRTLEWFSEVLGRSAPRLEHVVNPLVPGYRPVSKGDRPLIVFAGRLNAEKQPEHLVRAFAHVAADYPEWTLRLFGDGPLLPRLRRLISDLGINDRVELAGRVEDMPSEWAKASVMALSSKVEGLPLVMQEAMAAGLAILSYDCPNGPGELIEHESSGLLARPGDVDDLAVQMARLLGDRDLRQSLAAQAQRDSEQFAADVVAQTWERLFQELVDERDSLPLGTDRLTRVSLAGRRRAAAAEPEPAGDAGGWQAEPKPGDLGSEGPDGQAGGALVDDASSGDRPLVHGSPMPVGREVGMLNTHLLPADVVDRNLSTVVGVLERAQLPHFVIPPVNGGWVSTVVVPAEHRSSFAQAMAGVPHPEATYVQVLDKRGRMTTSGAVAEVAARLVYAAPVAVRMYELWSDAASTYVSGPGFGCEVQFWAEEEGHLVAPRPNEFVQTVPADELRSLVPHCLGSSTVQTLELMTRRTFDTVDFPIDAVYTWVDGSDPDWLASRASALSTSDEDTHHAEANSSARYRSRDELRYSLRSLEYFAPWIRHIYVVTAGQVPVWLTAGHPKVTVVDHADIFEASALPTFNSHAIESRIHRISGLSEHFLYLNDDFLLGRPVTPNRFFRPSGEAAVFRSPTKVGVDLPEGVTAAPHQQAALNNRKLLEPDFGRTLLRGMLHAPYPMRKSVLAEMERRYEEPLQATAHSAFRSPTDLSVTSSLFQHYALATGRGYEGSLKSAYVSLGAADVGERFTGLLRGRGYDSICIADFHEYQFDEDTIDSMVESFLQAYFPLACSFEADHGHRDAQVEQQVG